MGKAMSPFLHSAVLDRIRFILPGNDYIHESLDEFEIRQNPITGFHGNRLGYDGKNGFSSFFNCISSLPFHTCG